MLARLDFVETQIAIILKDEEKTVIHALLQDNKFPFAYDVRDNVTDPKKFSSLRYDIETFKSDIKFAVEMQVHAKKFQTEERQSWLLRIYISAYWNL